MRRAFRFYWLWLAIGLAGCAVTFYGCMMPHPPGPHLPHFDKFEHATTFLGLGVWFAALFRPRYAAVFAALAVFGGVIEIIQSQVGRDGDVFDLLADSVGIALGIAAAHGFAADWLHYIDDRVAATTNRAG